MIIDSLTDREIEAENLGNLTRARGLVSEGARI